MRAGSVWEIINSGLFYIVFLAISIVYTTVAHTPHIMSEFKVKTGLAQMLKGGVIMDVVTAEQAIIAEKAGA